MSPNRCAGPRPWIGKAAPRRIPTEETWAKCSSVWTWRRRTSGRVSADGDGVDRDERPGRCGHDSVAASGAGSSAHRRGGDRRVGTGVGGGRRGRRAPRSWWSILGRCGTSPRRRASSPRPTSRSINPSTLDFQGSCYRRGIEWYDFSRPDAQAKSVGDGAEGWLA